MNTKIRVLSVAAALCSAAAAGISVADAQETSKSKVYNLVQGFPEIFLDSRVKKAESHLTRYDDKVCFSVDTNSLPAGAYTVWLRSFTDPANTCSDGERIGGPTGNVVEGSQCSRRDIGPSGCIFSGQCSVFWTTAAIVGVGGKLSASACLDENETPGWVIFGDGIDDADTDEFHIVLKYHGEAAFGVENVGTTGGDGTGFGINVEDTDDSARLGRQITRLLGNCEGLLGDTMDPPADLTGGCPDQQIAVHPAGMGMGMGMGMGN